MEEMIEKLEYYTEWLSTYEEFASDQKNIDLAIVPLIQIWEIAWSMSKLYQSKPDIPYKEIIGFRNILVHMYHKVEAEVIRKIITKNIPILKDKLREYREQNNITL